MPSFSVEQWVALIGAVGVVIGSVALLVKNTGDAIGNLRKKPTPPPPVALGMTVEPDDHADDAIDSLRELVKELRRANRALEKQRDAAIAAHQNCPPRH